MMQNCNSENNIIEEKYIVPDKLDTIIINEDKYIVPHKLDSFTLNVKQEMDTNVTAVNAIYFSEEKLDSNSDDNSLNKQNNKETNCNSTDNNKHLTSVKLKGYNDITIKQEELVQVYPDNVVSEPDLNTLSCQRQDTGHPLNEGTCIQSNCNGITSEGCRLQVGDIKKSSPCKSQTPPIKLLKDNKASSLKFEWNKSKTLELIEIYEGLPCLWQVKSEDYKNRNLKVAAYQTLGEAFPSCSLECIKKKINTLRTQYHRELRCFINSKKSDTGTDDLYKPKLWCYAQLNFLYHHEKPKPSVSTLDETNIIEHDLEDSLSTTDQDISIDTSLTAENAPKQVRQNSKKHKSMKSCNNASDQVMELALKELSSLNAIEPNIDDHTTIMGKLVASELKLMKPLQQNIAKKLMSDVIFYAKTEMLDVTAKVIYSDNPPLHNSQFRESNTSE